MNILELSEQEIIRRQSLQELRDMGIDPYPAAEFPTNAFSTDIKKEFKDDEEPRQVSIAGRMMSRRVMGKASFAELQDSKGRIQVYVSRDDLCPGEDKDLYNKVFKKLLDIGDFIGVEGYVFRTQMGEISVHAQRLTLLSKSLKPLPIVKYKDGVAYDKFDDPEMRARQRYVDLVVNEGVKETFQKRAAPLLRRGRLHRSGDSHAANHTRRCLRPPLHHPLQRAQRGHVHAHRHGALPQATDSGRIRRRVRNRQELPQRRHGQVPQPRVHLHGAVRAIQAACPSWKPSRRKRVSTSLARQKRRYGTSQRKS